MEGAEVVHILPRAINIGNKTLEVCTPAQENILWLFVISVMSTAIVLLKHINAVDSLWEQAGLVLTFGDSVETIVTALRGLEILRRHVMVTMIPVWMGVKKWNRSLSSIRLIRWRLTI